MNLQKPNFFSYKLSLIIASILMIPLGIGCKIFNGAGSEVISNKLAGTVYVVFWTLLFQFLYIRTRPLKIAVWVFIVTSALEFSQLLKFGFLNQIRTSIIGRSLIGSSFSFSDFIFYFIGAAFGWFLIRVLQKIFYND